MTNWIQYSWKFSSFFIKNIFPATMEHIFEQKSRAISRPTISDHNKYKLARDFPAWNFPAKTSFSVICRFVSREGPRLCFGLFFCFCLDDCLQLLNEILIFICILRSTRHRWVSVRAYFHFLVCLSVCLSVCPFVCLSDPVSVCLSEMR